MLNGKKAGLALGSFAAFMHLVWVVLVALNWAQPWLDFVHRMHFISDSHMVMPFDLMRAVELIVLAFIMGNIFGNILAFFWNKFHKTA